MKLEKNGCTTWNESNGSEWYLLNGSLSQRKFNGEKKGRVEERGELCYIGPVSFHEFKGNHVTT